MQKFFKYEKIFFEYYRQISNCPFALVNQVSLQTVNTSSVILNTSTYSLS